VNGKDANRAFTGRVLAAGFVDLLASLFFLGVLSFLLSFIIHPWVNIPPT
jgi:hypothetical protein